MAEKVDKTIDQEDAEKDLETDVDEKEADHDTESDSDKDDSTDDFKDKSDESELTDAEKLARAEAKANKYRRLFHKSQKNKTSKSDDSAKRSPDSSAANVEETVLRANGMEHGLLKQLKDIAKLRNVSLLDAQSDDLFVQIKDKYEKDKKQKAASLPASRGSGSTKAKKELATPGLSRDEHKNLYKEKYSA